MAFPVFPIFRLYQKISSTMPVRPCTIRFAPVSGCFAPPYTLSSQATTYTAHVRKRIPQPKAAGKVTHKGVILFARISFSFKNILVNSLPSRTARIRYMHPSIWFPHISLLERDPKIIPTICTPQSSIFLTSFFSISNFLPSEKSRVQATGVSESRYSFTPSAIACAIFFW